MSYLSINQGLIMYDSSWSKYGLDPSLKQTNTMSSLDKYRSAPMAKYLTDMPVGTILVTPSSTDVNDPWIQLHNASLRSADQTLKKDRTNPFASPEKSFNMSDEEYASIYNKYEKDIWPAREEIINRYRQNGYAQQLDEKETEYDVSIDTSYDPTHVWKISAMSNILIQKINKEGYQLTPNEAVLFPKAAQVEWLNDNHTYTSETQSVTDAIQYTLSKNHIQTSSHDTFSVKFDQNLNYIVTGKNTVAAKIIQDTINGQPDYRYTLAHSLYAQTLPDGTYIPSASITTPFEYQANQLNKYMEYKNASIEFYAESGVHLSDFKIASDWVKNSEKFIGKSEQTQQLLNNNASFFNVIEHYYKYAGCTLQEPIFPNFNSAPITYSNNGFFANTDSSVNELTNPLFQIVI